MISRQYDLSIIQLQSSILNSQVSHFLASCLGVDSELSAVQLLESFAELELSFKYLKEHVELVEASLAAGHDPDRFLFSKEFRFDS